MYFFTSDEHYYHSNIIKYCNRPFADVQEMNDFIISQNNAVVKNGDTVIHCGDTYLGNIHSNAFDRIIAKLNGGHIFINGSHDRWKSDHFQRHYGYMEFEIEGQIIVCSHYPMLSWPKSHYGSWHLFGHWHSRKQQLLPIEFDGNNAVATIVGNSKMLEVSVDGHNFTPWSFAEIKEVMDKKPGYFVKNKGERKCR